MEMIWAVALGLLALVPILIVAGIRNEAAVLDKWILSLTPRGQRAYRELDERITDELTVADVPYQRALRLREVGSTAEAARLVRVGFDAIAGFAPDMLQLLAAMTVFSRMVSAMGPIAPLEPAGFQMRELTNLARAHRAFHWLLVSTAERFRLRIYILGRGLVVALRFIARSQETVSRHPASERAWEHVEAVHHDFGALTTETLASFRLLLVSLSPERRLSPSGHHTEE